MVGTLTRATCTSIANYTTENRVGGVFTAEEISDDLREIETLEHTVESDATAAEAESKILLQVF